MGHAEQPNLSAVASSAIDWWRLAGVDMIVDDAPRDWLAPPEDAAIRPGGAPLPADPVLATPRMPDTIDAFLAWRMGGDPPDAAWPGRRVPPVIVPGASIVVLTGVPEQEDIAAGALFAGSGGRLLDRMLAAIGRERGAVSLVPLATARPLGGQLPRDSVEQLSEIALHFLGVLAPETIISFGEAANRALFGVDGARARGRLRSLNLEGGKSADVVATLGLNSVLDRPASKATVWNDLLLLTGGKSQ